MKRTLVIFLICLLLVSCGDRKSKVTSKSLKQELTDSLSKYSNLTETLKRDDSSSYVLYLREVNKHKIGIVAITDSILFLFNQSDRKWIQIDSIKFDTYATSFEILDLNNDNNEDFIIHGFGNMHGQSKPYVFISDTNGVLRYRSDLHKLYNIRINMDKNVIESFYTGGVNSSHYKELYTWDKDSLILVEGVEHHNWMTTFYKNINGQRIDVKKIKDEDENIYCNALFTY